MLKKPYGILVVSLLLAGAVSAQEPEFFSRSSSKAASSRAGDAHLQSTPTGALFYNSSFAHGYRHGYEQGFHMGDLDIQMGRDPQNFEKTSEFRHDLQGFNGALGDKNSFRTGYRQGFRVAYREALAGLPFRGSVRTENAAKGLNDFLQKEERNFFDQGFSGGYLTASKLAKPSHVGLAYAEQYCQRIQSAAQPHIGEYCSGYSRGYLLGVSDSPTGGKDTDSSTRRDK
jgi:flagellar biosynthesis/type III secretory pathway protein FliH